MTQHSLVIPIGNSLSPVLCNLYINHFKTELSTYKLFPKLWFKYVDDVYTIVEDEKIDQKKLIVS